MALLEVTDLHTRFKTDDCIVKAVSGVTFSLDKGEILGIVGESGSGKSVTCLSVMKLDGKDILNASPRQMRDIRGTRMAMIFQDPMTSLNPVKSIGWQLEEAVLVHQDVTRKVARQRAIEILEHVKIPRADQRVDDYPHQFSGGMRQRVMIAMALINNPEILIADEPTTALDVTTQAQILNLMQDLQREFHMAIIMITHDLGVVAELSGNVVVMYGGRIVERAGVDELFTNPQMPYTWGLLGSLPRVDVIQERLQQISGQPPSLLRPPPGCPFNPRCEFAMDICRQELPALESFRAPDHEFRCHLDEETRAEIWSAKKFGMAEEVPAA